MKIRGLLAVIFSMSLAIFAGNALADGKSDGKAKSDKQSSKHSEKSDKSAKSSKPGNGYGHCKSDKSGKGHSKKKGKGHERDDDCDEPPVLVCSNTVERNDITIIIPDENGPRIETVSVNFSGNICDVEPATLDQYLSPIAIPSEGRTCFVSQQSIGAYTTSATEFWYPIDVTLECEITTPN